MKPLAVLLFTALALIVPIPVLAQSTVKESIRSQGKERSYYLFVPNDINSETPAPLIVMLHGTGRNGLSLTEKWTALAKKEKIIIVAPNASSAQGWKIPEDGPDFIYDVVEALKAKLPINPRRVYLFGHSAGATQALYLSLLESQYFAATAVSAGALLAEDGVYIARAQRKIPISVFVGTNDNQFPLKVVRATRDALNASGFNSELTEIKGHTHAYYDRADEINRGAWEFLKVHELSSEPKYQQHRFDTSN